MNTDQTFIQTIVEAISAIAGIFAVCMAIWTVQESRRPQVAVFLEHDRDVASVRLVVKNFGNGIARNIRFSNFDFSAVQAELKTEIEKGFLTNGIPVLVPEASRDTVLFAGQSALKEHDDFMTTVTVTYEEKGLLGRKKTVSDYFELDAISFYGSIYSKSDAYLTRIAIQSIADTLKKQIKQFQ